MVVKGACMTFRYVYPNFTEEGEKCYEILLQGSTMSLGSPTLTAPLSWNTQSRNAAHGITSREYSDENRSVIEQEMRIVLEATRSALT